MDINMVDYLNPDVLSYIFRFMDPSNLIVMPLICKQMYQYMKILEPNVFKVDYVLDLFSVPRSTKRDKTLIPKGQSVFKTVVHRLDVIHSMLCNLGFSMTLQILRQKIVRYGHYSHVKSLSYDIQHLSYDDVITLYHAVVLSGDLKRLKFVHRACPRCCYNNICKLIASTGNLQMLQWARLPKNYLCSRGGHRCDWNEEVTTEAARYGYFDVLKWALENGCRFDIRMKINVERYGHTHLLPLVNAYFKDDQSAPTCHAVLSNDDDLCRWCLESGYNWDYMMCNHAICYGYLPILKVAHQLGHPINMDICEKSVTNGIATIPILQWADQHGFPFDPYRLIDLVIINCLEKCCFTKGTDIRSIITKRKTYFEIFNWICHTRYVRVEHKKWLKDTFDELEPAINTQLIAWYLTHPHSNNLLNWSTFVIECGNLEVLQWAHSHNYTLPEDLCDQVAWMNRYLVPSAKLLEILKWAEIKGFKLRSEERRVGKEC